MADLSENKTNLIIDAWYKQQLKKLLKNARDGSSF